MRVPVLTYHGVNIAGNDYRGNDHVAFAADLALIQRLGLRIVPLWQVVENAARTGRARHQPRRGLSCDDGSDFDYHDLDHPTHGRQRSFYNALLDFAPPTVATRSRACTSPASSLPTRQRGRRWTAPAWSGAAG